MAEPTAPIIDPAAMRAKYIVNQVETLKAIALKDVTPAKLKQLIARVNASNTDSNNEYLSSIEAKKFIKKEITATRHGAASNNNLRTTIKKTASSCSYLDHEQVSENAENKLTGLAESTSHNIALLKRLANNADNSKEASKLAEKWMKPFLTMPGVSGSKATQELISSKFHKAGRETIAAIQDVLHKNPNIADALKKLPVMDGLGTLTPPEICQHLPMGKETERKIKAKITQSGL